MALAPQPAKRSTLTKRDLRAIAKALSDPRRFEILKKIAAQSCTACSALRETEDISAPTLSHHLKELEAARLIEINRQGKFAHLVFQRETWDAYLAELQTL